MIASHLQAGLRLFLAVVLVGTFAQLTRAEEPPPSFTNDVMAVLSKAGCNAGTCHGNQNGKGGFKLSLRGQDPAADFLALTRDQFGRRINAFDAEQSLILQKPAMQVPHEGGLRLKRDSRAYEIMQRWIAAGTSPDTSARAASNRSTSSRAIRCWSSRNPKFKFASAHASRATRTTDPPIAT